jgi:hypothetical protein
MEDEKTLELTLRYIESPHTETITFIFEGNKVTIETIYSFTPTVKQPALTGQVTG